MTRLIIVNGKGGVGKTSASGAIGVWLADHGYKVLLVSTDPAASVGDCLNQVIGKDPVEVQGTKNLTAIEINGKYEWGKLHDYIREHNQSGLDKFISREGIPGVDELAALFKVTMYLYDTRYDVIVVDTAPTGHTIKMLQLPDTMHETMEGIKGFLSTWGAFKQFITGTGSQAAMDKIDVIQTCVKHVKDVLTDPKMTHFNLVANPNYMCLREETRSYNELRAQGIKARNIILNMVQPKNDGCAWCKDRRNQQDFYIKKIEDLFRSEGLGVIQVEQRAREMVGIDLLRQLGASIMPQLAPGLDIQKAYRTRLAPDGSLIVDTQMPYVEPEHLKFVIDSRVLYMTIDYGLHEAATNALQFPRPLESVRAVDNGGKLMLVVN